MNDINKKLDTLNVTLSRDDNGQFTAWTTSEPLFCVVADSEDQIRAAIVGVITSYIRHFSIAESEERDAVELAEGPFIPVRRLTRLSTLHPRLRRREPERVCA